MSVGLRPNVYILCNVYNTVRRLFLEWDGAGVSLPGRFGALNESKSSREQRNIGVGLYYRSPLDLSENISESFHTFTIRLKHNNSIIIGRIGGLTPCSLIKISFKSRGKQIE